MIPTLPPGKVLFTLPLWIVSVLLFPLMPKDIRGLSATKFAARTTDEAEILGILMWVLVPCAIAAVIHITKLS